MPSDDQVKKISQSAFNDIVKENIDDLEMEPQEAVDDAVEQLKAQGVNLSLIVTDLMIYPDGHPLDLEIKKLKELKNLKDVHQLDEFIRLMKFSLSYRVYAAGQNALTLLNNLLDCSEPYTIAVVRSVTSLVSNQSDIVSEEHLNCYWRHLSLLIPSYGNISDDVELSKLMAAYIKLLSVLCVLCEQNRQTLVKLDVIPTIVDVLQLSNVHQLIVKQSCRLLRNFTLDDDVRVTFSKSHDHAKLIMSDTPALGVLLQLCSNSFKEADYRKQKTMIELYKTLSMLSVRDEFCAEVLQRGGVDLIVSSVRNNTDHSDIVSAAFAVLSSLARNDDVKRSLGRLHNLQDLVAAAQKHSKQSFVCIQFLNLLQSVTLRFADHSQTFVVDLLGGQLLNQLVHIHRDHSQIVKLFCGCVRNMAAREDLVIREVFLSMGFEQLLNEMLPECEEYAKLALVALGCDVKFKADLWTGTRGEIARD